MVVLNRIYTRTGDDGTTALGSGERRPKFDLRIAAYGTVDETNAAIGVVRLHLKELPELDAMLGLIQNDLFDLGADLAVPQREGKAERLRILSAQREIGAPDLLCAAGWHACRRLPSSRPHHLPPCGTDDGGTRGQARRVGLRCRHPIYESPFRLFVCRQPRCQQ
jgi:Cobalamin adenosyltransferase